jgi:hypothetical protein
MKWVLIASVVVVATFAGVFYYTGNTWTATNVAGLASLFYLIVFLYRLTRPPMPPKQKWWTLGVATIVLAGTTFFWHGMYITTNWQAETLHTIHKVIFHGVAVDLLKVRGLKTLSAYAAQPVPRKLSLGEVFDKETVYTNRDSSIIEIEGDNYHRVFAAAVSDTQVVLVCQSIIRIDGERNDFKNFDGRTGMAQDRLLVTKRGLVYEIQN